MKELADIGFYTLSNKRCAETSSNTNMKRCEMIITESCNFKCPYCRGLDNNIYGERKIKQLSLSEIKKNIDLWCLNGVLENIRFSGGEPTLHKDIVEIVKYAKDKGIKRIAISSNGSNDINLYYQLIKNGVNDFSISLDACCAEDGDKIAGNKHGYFDIVVENIKLLAKKTYLTVGIVLFPDNMSKTTKIIKFADSLGVSDIRIISSAQYNKFDKISLQEIKNIQKEFGKKYPILNYRINNLLNDKNCRGISKDDSHQCALILDDSVIAGDYFFPCVIYMREKGKPIGKISENETTMREKCEQWFKYHNTYNDPICKNNCLDVCVEYNNKYRELHSK